jgi:uncharacterized protein YifN (PemK superfamily)
MPNHYVLTPRVGQVVMCDFDSMGFQKPEMRKIRHCVVVARRKSNRVCLLVPFSTQPPPSIQPYHYRIAPNKYSFFARNVEIWAKADMLTHAGFFRLDRVLDNGRYSDRFLEDEDFRGVMVAVLHAVGLSTLVEFYT